MKKVCKASFELSRAAHLLYGLMSTYAEEKQLKPEDRNTIVDLMNQVQAQLTEVRRQVHMVPGE